VSVRNERAANALRVLVGEPVKRIPARWWHAYGRVREFERDDGQPADQAYQLTVIGPAEASPERARALGAESWGGYLTSFDHEPSNREKAAITPEEFRETEDELAMWDELDAACPDDEEW